MNSITKLYNGHNVRFVVKNDLILFCLSDVGDVLGLSNAYRQVEGLKGVHTVHTLTSGGKQNIIYIDEPVLYRLIFKSRKEESKKFQDWVFEEVLPSIRKTGSYSIPQELKEKSIKSRNMMTETWKENGVTESKEYAFLTVEEYKQLRIPQGKRKKDFDKKEILLLQALEALETLNLHYNPVKGFIECKQSLISTANNIKKITEKT